MLACPHLVEQPRHEPAWHGGLATKSGIRNSLLAKLKAALARLQGGNPADACDPLHAFINEVNAQRGKSISASDADALVAAARQIMVVNGCGP